MHSAVRPITVAILAMGGEGGGVLADWIVDLAEHAGFAAQTTSVPGVAQRTGATIYYVEFYPVRLTANDAEPILALTPVAGDVDIVLCSELMEAGRAVERGIVTPDRTALITSTHRVYSMTEKTAMGDGRVESTALIKAAKRAARRFIAADFAKLADEAGSVISAALFGALAGARLLPFERADFEAAIERSGVGVAASLRAFQSGYVAAEAADVNDDAESSKPSTIDANPRAPISQAPSDSRLAALDKRIVDTFPVEVHRVLHAGVRRLADYQDVAYASAYLDDLDPIRTLDGGRTAPRWALLTETARYLALWMSYEDTVRVAELKIRSGRFARVADEVKLGKGQMLNIDEFLHPRVDEIADTLPFAVGAWLSKPGWVRRFVERRTKEGRIVRTSSLRGFLLLYFVASMRRWRRGSLRFAREMGACRRWLATITSIAETDYALAVEFACCQRLVKGYGDTHERGMKCFTLIEEALSHVRGTPDAAARVRALREAALADESGGRLADMLGKLRAPIPASGDDAPVRRAEPSAAATF